MNSLWTEVGACFDNVFAVVHKQQHLRLAERLDEPSIEVPICNGLDADDGRNPIWDERRIQDLREFDQPHAVAILVEYLAGQFDPEARLTPSADASERQESGSAEANGNSRDLLFSADKTGQSDWQVVASGAARHLFAPYAATPSHRFDCPSKVIRIHRRQSEGGRQARGRVSVGVRRAKLELLDPIDAQASAFGERLLCEPGRHTVLPEQRAEVGRGPVWQH